MNYFELLGLTREPFSNSPDPVFFFESQNHAKSLHRLEIAVRLRRGLNVCLGPIGSGKSTLCRTLIQGMANDSAIVPHLILDPTFSTARELLVTLHTRFLRVSPSPEATHREMMEALQQHLFQEAQESRRILVLIIDEGQKLAPSCLEVIRELLNYETNDAKLLQVIIFAQEEFDVVLAEMPNFQDRINEFCRLTPLNFRDTRALIRHRLSLAGTSRELFTWPAYWALYRASRGTPRKIMHLGHKALMTLIVTNKSKVNRNVVLACARPLGWDEDRRPGLLLFVAVMLIAMLTLVPRGLQEIPALDPAAPESKEAVSPAEIREPVSHAFLTAPARTDAIPPSVGTNNQDTDETETDEMDTDETETVSLAPVETPSEQIIASGEHDSIKPGQMFSGSRFYVQAGAFLRHDAAESAVLAMRARHKTAGTLSVTYNGRQWNIVYIDHFDTLDQAIRKAEALRENEGLEVVVVEAEGMRYRPAWK
ncbi:AAA family ATPase [Desulfonatronum lacustre]|uniref:AAA family ATPase n=1 Tax=Desulfonatronum lacustre TaxID=66849 RepID=UPI0004AE2A3F|nr:AAA family ATPase [Desulfonatronum lacustre]